MKKFAILLFVIVFCSLAIHANEGLDKQARPFRFAEWAWETSYDMFEKHPITAYSYWRPVLNPITVDLETEYKRFQDNVDELSLTEVLFFHPLVLNLPNDATVALGAYVRGGQVFREGWEDIPNAVSAAHININMVAFGFSMLWSFPSEGLQMQFLVGYTWTRAEVKSHTASPEITLPNPPFPPPNVYPSVVVNQKTLQQESGLDLSYRFTWHSEKRNFLPGMDFHVKSYLPVGHSETTQKINFPTIVHPVAGPLLGPIKQDVDSSNSSFVNARLYASLFGFLADAKAHPLYPKYIRQNYVSFDLVGDVSHVAAEHGHALALGFRINLAETLFFSYMHGWEQKNDSSDYDSFRLEFTVSI